MTTAPTQRSSKTYRLFVLLTMLTLAAFLAGLFAWVYVESRRQVREIMLTQARALFESVVVTRRWNADLGGVYAFKSDTVQSNPYLEHPDVTAADGRVLTLKNPALMTVEISAHSQEAGLFSFRMVGERPLNPRNEPDDFERKALETFARGRPEFWRMVRGDGTGAILRYMSPLRIEESCLPCHAKQNYRVGDVKGGVSVSLDIGDVLTRHERWFHVATGSILAAAVLLAGLILLYFRRLRAKLVKAQELTEQLANTDALTGVPNRRQLMSRLEEELARSSRTGKPLACALLDVDHFKRVNDTLGHQVGDEVLVALTRIVREVVRSYDLLGRFGGEEFLLLLPETDLEKAAELAERVRQAMQERLAATAGATLLDPVTVSLGVTAQRPGDTLESIIKRADDALYRAKQNGRNRVEQEA